MSNLLLITRHFSLITVIVEASCPATEMQPEGLPITHYRRCRGFTLLELVLCIFVVSLFLMLSLPSFTAVGQRKADGDAKMAASMLRFLYDSALSRKEAVALTVDLNRRTLSYQSAEGERTETVPSLRSLTLPSRGRLHEGQVTVVFTGLGIPENLRLAFGSDDRPDVVVTVSHLSGRVSVNREDTDVKAHKQ